MGMDVYGKKPRNEVGEYFRNNVWYWHPLWDYCCLAAPEIATKVIYGHDNSGDGLNSFDSRRLSKVLKENINNGTAEEYILNYYKYIDSLPEEECFCITKEPYPGICSICKGSGKTKWLNMYHIDIENIFNFSEFLEYCGGFEIC